MTHIRTPLLTLAAASCLLLGPDTLDARVTAFEATSTTPMYDGRQFGTAGSIERIEGVARFAVDPGDARVADIDGLERAPTNDDGEVEFSTRVVILRPTGQGSGTLFYDVANRGRNLSLALLNRSGVDNDRFSVDDPGDGFLMRHGHTLVWSGWQAGLASDFLTLDLPVLPGVTGTSRDEFIFDTQARTSRASLSYPSTDLDPKAATLTVRPTPGAPRETPDGLSFRYIDDRTLEITRPEGYGAGAIFEFIYPATGAMPSGLAFLATSDLVSFLRGRPGHDANSPLRGIDHTIGLGISQSGRFLRDFIHQGFNADANGQRVFDGAMAHIAGSRKTFTNDRFAQPGRFSRQHEDHDYPGDQFPFSYADTTDPLSGRHGSILSACTATDTCPKLMHTDTSTEFWQGRASLVSTAPDGKPLTMPKNVRLYFLAGMPHFNVWDTAPEEKALCRYPTNPLSPSPTMRALASAMQAWVADGTAPPASAYPGLEAGTLTDPTTLRLPRIQGARPTPPVNTLNVMNHEAIPPAAGAAYAIRVPAVDDDGLPQGGVRMPYITAPTGTYWGWNLRAAPYGENELCSLNGSYLAFPATFSSTDSRHPLSARYPSRAAYLGAVRRAAEQQVEAGLMLPGDVDMIVRDAPAYKTP